MTTDKNIIDTKKDKIIQFKIDGETKEKFQKYCEIKSINASDLLRKFIKNLLKEIDKNEIK